MTIETKKNIASTARGILFWVCVTGIVAFASLELSLQWVV